MHPGEEGCLAQRLEANEEATDDRSDDAEMEVDAAVVSGSSPAPASGSCPAAAAATTLDTQKSRTVEPHAFDKPLLSRKCRPQDSAYAVTDDESEDELMQVPPAVGAPERPRVQHHFDSDEESCGWQSEREAMAEARGLDDWCHPPADVKVAAAEALTNAMRRKAESNDGSGSLVTPTPARAEVEAAAAEALAKAVRRKGSVSDSSGTVPPLTPAPNKAELEVAAAQALAGAVRRKVSLRNRLDDGEASDCSEDSGTVAAMHVPVPTFAAAKKYEGGRIGRIFKLGLAGLGYYVDNGPMVQVNLMKGLSR